MTLTLLQKKKKTRFPISRIKKLIQQNEDIGKTTSTVPVVLSRSIELFMEGVISKMIQKADSGKTTKINTDHLMSVIKENEDLYWFLKDLQKEGESVIE